MVDTKMEFRGKYLSLTSYKRDGTAVSTRVWSFANATDPASPRLLRTRAKSSDARGAMGTRTPASARA